MGTVRVFSIICKDEQELQYIMIWKEGKNNPSFLRDRKWE